MKKVSFMLCLLLPFLGSFAQNIFPATGNVGIGTTSPLSELHINGEQPTIRLTSVDTTLPSGAIRGLNSTWLFGYRGQYGQEDISIGTQDGTGSRTLTFAAGGHARVKILANGNTLIGKNSQTNSSYKLDVNGDIRANKVVVNTTGADFVFDPAYQPPSPDSLRRFIQAHHHLPGIPAASEMQQQGLDVGTNQALLLQKIEELTLYILRQDSVQQVLLDRLSRQQAQINALNHTRTLTGNKK